MALQVFMWIMWTSQHHPATDFNRGGSVQVRLSLICYFHPIIVFRNKDKLASMPEDRYPRRVFIHVWDAKQRRGRQRKVWSRLVDDIFSTLDVDKEECLGGYRERG